MRHNLCRITISNQNKLHKWQVRTEMKSYKIFNHYGYLNYKAKVIFSYHGFIGENEWFEFAHFKQAGLQHQTPGFASQFLYLNWDDVRMKNLVDIETYKILYEIRSSFRWWPWFIGLCSWFLKLICFPWKYQNFSYYYYVTSFCLSDYFII